MTARSTGRTKRLVSHPERDASQNLLRHWTLVAERAVSVNPPGTACPQDRFHGGCLRRAALHGARNRDHLLDTLQVGRLRLTIGLLCCSGEVEPYRSALRTELTD